MKQTQVDKLELMRHYARIGEFDKFRELCRDEEFLKEVNPLYALDHIEIDVDSNIRMQVKHRGIDIDDYNERHRQQRLDNVIRCYEILKYEFGDSVIKTSYFKIYKRS